MPRRSVLALVLTLASVLAACTSSDPTPGRTPDGGGSTGVTSEPSPEHETRAERTLEAVLAGDGDFVVLADERYLPMWEKLGPKDPSYVFDTHNRNGGPSPMLIADAELDEQDRPWFEVYLPIRPNGETAWASAEDVRVQERHERIEVDLSKRVLERYRDGELVDRFRVGVGTDQHPTGTGTFYVWVKVPFENPNLPYGIFALGLSGFSPVLSDWPGEGRMAIHGTPYASDRGQAVSHGCVRVFNADMESLIDVPLGTPVVISP
jgi:lipoprotein-anchoring transpeptidase ErfK/SrfK